MLPSYTRYLRRKALEFFDLKGVPLRIWFRSRFQLRTDEELQGYIRGVRPDFREWDEADEALHKAVFDADADNRADI